MQQVISDPEAYFAEKPPCYCRQHIQVDMQERHDLACWGGVDLGIPGLYSFGTVYSLIALVLTLNQLH